MGIILSGWCVFNNPINKSIVENTPRKVADCRKMPSIGNCDLYMSGSEKYVLEVSVAHAVNSHGHTDTSELHEQIRATLTDETIAV